MSGSSELLAPLLLLVELVSGLGDLILQDLCIHIGLINDEDAVLHAIRAVSRPAGAPLAVRG